MWDAKVLQKSEFNKYGHMLPSINVLTIFEEQNLEALTQLMLDFLMDETIVISFDGTVVASGVTAFDLPKGCAASAAARGDGCDESTFSVAIRFSGDDTKVKLSPGISQKVMVFNGALLGEDGKKGYEVLIRNPKSPTVTDEEFVRLAENGHVAGVEAFTKAAGNQTHVDTPRDAAGSSALVCAASNGRIEVIPLLLEAGANVNLRDENGWSGLMFAAQNGHALVVEMLLTNGANKDLQENDTKTTALMIAAAQGHVLVVEKLLCPWRGHGHTKHARLHSPHLLPTAGATTSASILLLKARGPAGTQRAPPCTSARKDKARQRTWLCLEARHLTP
eukprot:FR734763.1.p1 GENE.FR734763.1~~FR734763.1.p1  ORF type:complete len:335 (+),score=65.95 FR734763.1:3-1007(+)